MQAPQKAALGAAALALVFYVAMPLIANKAGIVPLPEFALARAFLILVGTVLAIQIIFATIASGSFTFTDHGFQLCLASAAGFMTLVGLWLLKGGGSGAIGLPDTYLMVGFLGALFFTAVTMMIYSSDRAVATTQTGLLHPGWRLLNYMLGVIAFEFYVFYMLQQEFA